ncbi:magnesium-translocating P-type ATPase [Exiguobacterium flavidum]|uniref:magnesium-translocating P-type ATPase n=1 Tax=Exiguobacterium flavidum TaxID=2184695 RepID=UPI001300A326|nr:magnesium-translocating P-type ATPase [Exiguobacterium flavidum]
MDYWSMPADQVVEQLGTRRSGLTEEEAASRLQTYGANIIREQKRTTRLSLLLSQFKNPIIVILLIATLISAGTGEWIDATIIFVIILASATLSFFQEHRASRAIEELRAKVQTKSHVLRNGSEKDVPSSDVVPGDIVLLSIGSLIPADGLILSSTDFYVNQSILTGESLLSQKSAGILPASSSVEERTNCVFTGTNVHSGNAVMIALQTGRTTVFGQIAEKLQLRPPETEFESGLRHFGYLLTRMMLILTLAVFAINIFVDRPVIDALLFSVAVAVGLTPQLLSAIVSITLSNGSRMMAKEGVIVRRLNSIENFGSMDILCTDKTGTLTEGVVRLSGALDSDGRPSDSVFRLAFINASLQNALANSLDKTIVAERPLDLRGVTKREEIPFDFTRKRLSLVVEEEGVLTLITKGAFHPILSACSHIAANDGIRPIDLAESAVLEARYTAWGNEGIRVLGVASKTVGLKNDYTTADEADLTFQGFLLFSDQPKEDADETIAALARSGVSLCVISGDNKLVALHTAKAVGLDVKGVLTGGDLIKMNDEALWYNVETTNVFAEVDPNQKERILLAFKKNGHVVGYLGDGINDVPALHAADVSISVDTAVDVAKESADFVLLEKNLDVLNRGIILGRTTFANTLKYIMITTSANFGNMFSMVGVSLFLPFLPLLPKQILMINFLSDFPAITIASDAVDEEILETPRRWDIKEIQRFMIVFGLISSVFDYLTFAVLFFFFKAYDATFQSAWFTFSVLTELLLLLVMRTRKPFYKSRPARPLLYSTIIIFLLTLLLPYLPVYTILRLEPVRLPVILSLFGLLGGYVIMTEIGKHYFFKKVSTRSYSTGHETRQRD